MEFKKIKGVIFISNVNKALEHEWFCEFVDKGEFELEFILFNSNKSELYNFITKSGFKCKNYSLKSKFFIPFYVMFFYFKLVVHKYDFVHCHLFEASLIGLISGKWAGIRKRIHTRHHADFHHIYFPKAVKYDLLINRYSTQIIAVSNNIRSILVEKELVDINKIAVIPHGIPLSVINKQVPAEKIESIRVKYGLDLNHPVIGVVSRFTEWKGIQYIIPAFKKLLEKYPKAKLVLANAQGDYSTQLSILLKEVPNGSYILIPFENQMNALFKNFDVFVHTPIDSNCEAFGQVYIEALCLNVPMVCTLSGIANDLIINEENAIVVPYKNSDEIYCALKKLLTDGELRDRIIRNGNVAVQKFSFEKKYEKLKQLYLS